MSSRMERIEKLLRELEYEVTRGMMEREIDEQIGFRFVVPISQKIKDGTVNCEFRTRPVPRGMAFYDDPSAPRLTVVKGSVE